LTKSSRNTGFAYRAEQASNPIFHQIIPGGLSWALGQVNADITTNITYLMPR
jgi:hypothetical protein